MQDRANLAMQLVTTEQAVHNRIFYAATQLHQRIGMEEIWANAESGDERAIKKKKTAQQILERQLREQMLVDLPRIWAALMH